MEVAARVVRGTEVSGSGAAEDDGGWGCAGSLVFGFTFDFCFAALTLALERNVLETAERGSDWSWSGMGSLGVEEDVLALLWASGLWIGCKSI